MVANQNARAFGPSRSNRLIVANKNAREVFFFFQFFFQIFERQNLQMILRWKKVGLLY